MDKERLRELLQAVAEGRSTPEEACEALASSVLTPYARLTEGVCLDTARALRTGQPEVVFGQGKDDAQLAAAVRGLADAGQPVLVTRCGARAGAMLLEVFPGGEYWERPGLFCLGKRLDLSALSRDNADVLVVAAGAADAPVALEALGAARFFGLAAGLVSDVGVAGLHRLLPHSGALSAARLLIVVAGMEGALPSVVAGMFSAPVIGVPTSVGYGTGIGGLAALLSMLNSCAPGLCVVNIDNGYGAAALAAKLLAVLPRA